LAFGKLCLHSRWLSGEDVGSHPAGLRIVTQEEGREVTTDDTDITDEIFRVDEVDLLSVFIRVIRGQNLFLCGLMDCCG